MPYLFLFCIVCPSSQAEANAGKEERKYIVVIDAGSTGSRVHVYPYIPAEPLPTFLPQEEFTLKKKPGLSSFQHTPEKAGASLSTILEMGKKHIPSTVPLDTVPIFLVATAGLRKVQSVDPEATSKIMSSVRSSLSNSGFKFKDGWAQIITGVDEGSYGWVTVNYLLESFLDTGSTTTGVLEMGGESVQLTFEPKGQLPDSITKDLTPVSIGGRTYNLFAHSWMGYGVEAAQAKFDNKVADEKTSPCYLSGDTRKSTGSDSGLTFKGEGNYAACYLLLKDDLKIAKGSCEASEGLHCVLDGVKIPKDTGSMVFIENFWYTANVAGFEKDQMKGKAYYEQMHEFGTSYCKVTHPKASAFLSDLTDYKANEEEIHKQCFCSAYVEAMIKEGMGFSALDDYEVVRTIRNADLDWALGYAIVQEATGVARGQNSSSSLLLYTLVLLIIVMLLYYFYRRRKRRAGYQGYGMLNNSRDPFRFPRPKVCQPEEENDSAWLAS